MKPAGYIGTYMKWSDWKELTFNIALFLWQIVFMVVGTIIGKVYVKYDGLTYRPTWRKVWRAAQCSHVRLVLEETDPEGFPGIWNCINFGYPKAEIQMWSPYWNRGNREYRDPMFDPSPQFIAAMIEYAEAQVGKRYDHLQLLSFGLNFIVWLFWPPWWGQEKLKWLNLHGGREVCSSGVTACLRWGEGAPRRVKTRFFKIYHIPVVPPCLVPLSKNWRRE